MSVNAGDTAPDFTLPDADGTVAGTPATTVTSPAPGGGYGGY